MCATFYIRFATSRPASASRGATDGVFRPAYDAARAPEVPEWLRGAIREEIDWFEDHLAIPRRFGVVTRKSRRAYAGVCWFRDDARECVRRADMLAALVEAAGVPIARLVSDAPGDIVWRDENQIVAIPRVC